MASFKNLYLPILFILLKHISANHSVKSTFYSRTDEIYMLASKTAISKTISAENVWTKFQSASDCNLSNEGNITYSLRHSTVGELSSVGPCSYERNDWIYLFTKLSKKHQRNKELVNLRLIVCIGDCNFKPPSETLVLSKARLITAPNFRTVTLLPLNINRHFKDLKYGLNDKILFENKKPIAVWRGVTTGENHCWVNNLKYEKLTNEYLIECPRSNLATLWSNSSSKSVDVGITKIVQYTNFDPDSYSYLLKNYIPIKDMLKYRYIISVEGNDVATNLKWALASNSVVLMPKPRIETFFGEGRLEPYVHYIPLRSDTKDLIEKIEFCEERISFCKNVSKNGRNYALKYKNLANIYEMGLPILEKHLHAVLNQNKI